MPAESIWFPILETSPVNDLKVKFREFFNSINLMLIENLEGSGSIVNSDDP
jgi:hypothetical protein